MISTQTLPPTNPPATNPAIRLAHFMQALARVNLPTFARVIKAYTKDNGYGYKLAFINAKKRDQEIKDFTWKTQAEDRFVNYNGLEKYLTKVLKDNDQKHLLKIFDPKRVVPTSGLLDFHKINVLTTLVADHPLAKFITKQQPLFMEDYVSILKSGFVDLHTLKSGDDKRTSFGILEASQGPSHGQDSAWTRDMAAVALGKLDVEQTEYARKIATKLYEAYTQESQRRKINNLLFHPDHNDFPHTKWTIKTVTNTGDDKIIDYKLGDYEGSWEMKQLDAYGYVLTLLAKLAYDNEIDIKGLDEKAKTDNKAFYNGKTESTLVALARMLINIKYWNTGDRGAWEWPEHRKRASSIAACISGLTWVKKYFEKHDAFNDPSKAPVNVDNDQNYNMGQFKKDLDAGIEAGEKYLFKHRIPLHDLAAAGSRAKELNKLLSDYDQQLGQIDRHKDAALLFILTLSDPKAIGKHGISPEQENSILRTVYDLMGDVGFKRFPKDEYMGMDWTLGAAKHKHTKNYEHANNDVPNYKPAEWCLFDPYLATHFYKKFLNSEGKDLESYLRADRHARRSLAQITKSNYTFYKQEYATTDFHKPASDIKVPAGEVMESYWYKSKDPNTGTPLEHGSWMPGENYRLNWTKIALQQMVYWGSKAGLKFKAEYPNGWDKQEITGLNLSMLGEKGRVGVHTPKAAAV